MKLLRIGNVTLNMDQLVAIKDDGDRMTIAFAGSKTRPVLTVTLDGYPCGFMRAWLARCGVSDLSTENPAIDWM